MKLKSFHWILGAGVAIMAMFSVRAQVTITASDFFNQVGQYYLAYGNILTNTVPVSNLLGTPGGPQVWDFSTGPQDITYRFDYVAATNAFSGTNFSALGATIAERKVDLADTNVVSWLYFTQDPVMGRLDYGFYDPNFSKIQPQAVFTNALQDFPNVIHFGDTWQGSTVFSSAFSDVTLGDYPEQITYTSTDKVDAYGVITLPNLGFLNCLRIHEVVQYNIAFDLGSGFQNLGTQSLLNYYWVCPGHGIVVQINSTSPTDGSVPPDGLPGGAAALIRMFQTNHPQATTNGPTSISGFTCTLGQGGALLKWTLASGITTYAVQYTTNLVTPATWTPLGTTTGNFYIDAAAAMANSPTRLYRITGN